MAIVEVRIPAPAPPSPVVVGAVGGSTRAQGTLSLNAAIFAAVLLASRLESNEKVFGLVLFALELFAFFPLARYTAQGVFCFFGLYRTLSLCMFYVLVSCSRRLLLLLLK